MGVLILEESDGVCAVLLLCIGDTCIECMFGIDVTCFASDGFVREVMENGSCLCY